MGFLTRTAPTTTAEVVDFPAPLRPVRVGDVPIDENERARFVAYPLYRRTVETVRRRAATVRVAATAILDGHGHDRRLGEGVVEVRSTGRGHLDGEEAVRVHQAPGNIEVDDPPSDSPIWTSRVGFGMAKLVGISARVSSSVGRPQR